MPCFNDGLYIEEAIETVLNQTYKDIELIIINDGSTDELTNRILNTTQWPSQVKVIQSGGIGPAGARNLGIKTATGEYILPVDSDDRIDPTYIEKAVKIMIDNPRVGVVYCQAELFGEQTGRWDLPNYSLEKMLLDNIVFVTAMFYKKDWEAVNGFNEKMKNGMEDYDFWLSLLEIDREIYQIPEVLFYYRIKPISRTTRFQKSMDQVVETYRQIYLNHPILYSKYKDLYANILRDELIHQLFLNRALKESISYIEYLDKFPRLKKIINYFMVKRSK
ncbi:MAG: glycosyltransferase family A protein [Zhenhengia sp.]